MSQFQLPFMHQIERMARPKAVFSHLRPTAGLGSMGNKTTKAGLPVHMASGGIVGNIKNMTGKDWLNLGMNALSDYLGGPVNPAAPAEPVTGYANGGIIGAGMRPRAVRNEPNLHPQPQGHTAGMDHQLMAEAMKALMGQSQYPQQAIQAFVTKYGQAALAQLQQKVQMMAGAPGAQGVMPQQPQMQTGGIVRGPGTGTSDSVPAIHAQTGQPIALSNGEYVLPHRVVNEIGKGSTELGAKKLDAMIGKR
jgi:hypothetical protein